jgi:glycosyltransferase involved in cell wall biosynthesis
MKILHIIGGDTSGGAAKGALTLHKELLLLGIDSCILKQVGERDVDNKIYTFSHSFLTRIKRIIYTFFDRLPLLLLHSNRKKNAAFSAGYFGFDLVKSKHYKNADVVNLHWINQGTFSLRTIKKINKPIVWTLRDMWAMTGGCHHSFDCEKYVTQCSSCPVLGSERVHDLSWLIFRYKKRTLPGRIKYVAISKWLEGRALNSRLLNGCDIKVIYNGVSSDEFRVFDKNRARNELGLPVDLKIVLLGAGNLHDPYKGFSYFLECLPALLSRPDIYFMFFGHFDEAKYSKVFKDRFISFGPIKEQSFLNMVYSAADVFVAPSIAEAFGKTLVESMLSGTPVVCFDSTGPSEIVIHKKTGYKAIDRSCIDLAIGINWCLEDMTRLSELSLNARLDAEKRFSARNCALQYKRLYEGLLSHNPLNAATSCQ